jgi:very-short-patch-repair endonuclease
LQRDEESDPRLQATQRQWQNLRTLAREKRRDPTSCEGHLWQALRSTRPGRLKFRRQHAIEGFIVDFYCVKASLVIEVDGPIHEQQREEDAERQSVLETLGLTVLRFAKDEVLDDLGYVLSTIEKHIEPQLRSPSTRIEPRSKIPSPRKERGPGGEVYALLACLVRDGALAPSMRRPLRICVRDPSEQPRRRPSGL